MRLCPAPLLLPMLAAAAAAGAAAGATASADHDREQALPAAAPQAGSSGSQCEATVDNPTDPRHGMVRAGGDYKCTPLPDGASVAACSAACCGDQPRCKSFSFNAPWTLPQPYMAGCMPGKNCCCLKSSVPGLEANHWTMNITTGTVPPPPLPACSGGLCCSLNGELLPDGKTCRCDPAWTGSDCGELALLPAPSIAGAYQQPASARGRPAPQECGVSCGPSSWGGLPLKGPDGKYHLFAAQFVQNCTLAAWNPSSFVVRAVADTPEGPCKCSVGRDSSLP